MTAEMNDELDAGLRFPRWQFVFVFALTIAIRIWYCWPCFENQRLAIQNDSPVYQKHAGELQQGHFAGLFRTPGYPAFLALMGAIPGRSPIPALLGQVVMEGLSSVLLTRAVRRIDGLSHAAFGAGVLYALCPVAATLTALLMSEPLSIFLTLAGVNLALHNPTENVGRSGWPIVSEALCWIGATMTRPFNLLVPVWLFPFLLLANRRRGEKRPWHRRAAVLAIYFVALGGWIGWNQARSGMPVLCTNPQVSFYIYEVPAARIVAESGWSWYAKFALLKPAEFDRRMEQEQSELIADWYADATEKPRDLWFTMDDPREIRRLHAAATQRMEGQLGTVVGMHGLGLLQMLRPKWNSGDAVTRVLELARLLLFGVGLGNLMARRQWGLVALVAVWICYAGLLPGPCSHWRFRSAAEPVISVVGAVAITSLRWRSRSLHQAKDGGK